MVVPMKGLISSVIVFSIMSLFAFNESRLKVFYKSESDKYYNKYTTLLETENDAMREAIDLLEQNRGRIRELRDAYLDCKNHVVALATHRGPLGHE